MNHKPSLRDTISIQHNIERNEKSQAIKR